MGVRTFCGLRKKKKKLSPDVAAVGSTFYLPSQDQDLDNGNNSSGLSASALQNIREQMAQSLERMKELEEQVKAIPVLQIQLSVLKDEKRKLQEKLKASEMKRNTGSDLLDADSFVPKKYHTLPLKSGLDIKTPHINETSLVRKPSMRDVSVSCITMMRDVGVSHCEPPVMTRDVGVSHSPPPVATRDTAVSPIPQRATKDVGVNSLPADSIPPEGCKSLTQDMVTLKSIIKKSELKDTGTVTDLLHSQIYSDVELDKNINKAIKMFEKTYLSKIRQNRLENVSSIGIQASPTTDTLKIIEKNDRGVQAVPEVRFRSFGVNCVVKTRDAQTIARPETHTVGVSDDTLDFVCEKCANGLTNLTNGGSHIKPLSLATMSVGRSKSFDYSDRSPLKKLRTRSIACGTTHKINSTKSCDTSDLAGRLKDVGVNTIKRKLVDTAVGDSLQQVQNVNICDKCSNTIKTVAKNILNQSRGDLTSTLTTNSVSRIPRPSTLTTVSSNTKKPTLLRQDTYTKSFITPESIESAKNSLSWLKDQSSIRPYCAKRGGSSSDDGSDDVNLYDAGLPNDHGVFEPPLFQPIQGEPRKKVEPSKEMRAAMKVLNDALAKSPSGNLPPQMKNAINIIQQEWFKISSTANANPLDVEDYLDCLEEISSRLLEYVVNMTDVSGNTAMHYAVSHGNFDVVSILLDSKVCNINQTNAAGYTCIMLVSLAQVRSETHRQVIKRLFQMADVNIRAKQHGQTALMLAVSHGRLDMVQLLLECGADMNIQDEDGSTALMCAAEHHHVEIVKLLLAQPDCDLTIRDYDGQTALNIAMEAGNRDIGVLLYAQEHFSRGSSPYTSLKHRRAKSTTPTLRTPTSPQPRTKQDHSF
ncbi:KN motif and ankyrin repeat domain-containing protein 1 isoform X2 [Macrosteles quadrilineatus]|uniref:KN motif and ankyrin repeat domain-containing protein 1 isoform X2 n=1 Tax=Macrosteles quadrilineatus TaxID=74068 RepID=UPI0023E30E6F|nr:KN motif and ankyrin repeat domain-containing protein 1 isoform X2 [Macrosteles quadrilineatus]